jgi:hypothetical protein
MSADPSHRLPFLVCIPVLFRRFRHPLTNGNSEAFEIWRRADWLAERKSHLGEHIATIETITMCNV